MLLYSSVEEQGRLASLQAPSAHQSPVHVMFCSRGSVPVVLPTGHSILQVVWRGTAGRHLFSLRPTLATSAFGGAVSQVAMVRRNPPCRRLNSLFTPQGGPITRQTTETDCWFCQPLTIVVCSLSLLCPRDGSLFIKYRNLR